MALCPLCRVRDGDRKSHILSDFLYQDAYDERHSLISFDQELQRRGKRFSSYWEQLFCSECEGRFGKWESYFADVWFNRPKRPIKLEQEFVVIRGLDYARFKLFHLSILWRASQSTLPAFASVSLGPHDEKIRDLLLREDASDPDVYPIAGRALRDDDGSFKDDILSLPAGTRIDGYHVYRMLYGGVFWYCAVASHHSDCPVPAALQRDGTITLMAEKWTRDPGILSLAADVIRLESSYPRPAA